MINYNERLRGAVARGWCSEKNADKEVDADLAEAIVLEVVSCFSDSLATRTSGKEHIVPLANCPMCGNEADFVEVDGFYTAECCACGLTDWNRRTE